MTISILIATDSTEDTQSLEIQLTKDHKDCLVLISSKAPITDFDTNKPDILVLAFETLAKAENYYKELYHSSKQVASYAHRSILLCNKDELELAYQACKQKHFDDYVLFWPTPADNNQLSMAIHRAQLSLENAKAYTANRELSKQSQGLSNLDTKLEADLNVAHELLEKLQQDLINQNLNALNQPLTHLKTWLQELRSQYTPHFKSVRLLKDAAQKIPPTILVVDDDKFAQNLSKAALAEENYIVIVADSGYQALKLLSKQHPDLILMDMNMPDLDGLETTRRIKALEQLTTIPIIMVTGNQSKADVINCLKAGASDYIVKPLSHGTLLDKIHKLLH